MADAYPIASMLMNMKVGDTGHVDDHKAERAQMNLLKDWMSSTGIAPLDLFATGGSDSDKLDAAILYCRNLNPNRTPRIGMTNRMYTFTRSIGQPYDGFHWEGIGKGQLGIITGTAATTQKNHTTLKVEVPKAQTSDPAGYFINATTEGRDWYIGGFNAFSDNGVTQMYRAPFANGSAGLGECNFVDQTYQNFYSIFGNSSEAISFTICDIYGGWGIFESRSTAVHIRGSDCRRIFSDGVDIYNSGKYPGLSKWMMMFTALGKSNVGGIYLTAWGGWRGIKIYGIRSTGQLNMTGMVVEGNNQGEMCHGNLIRIENAANVSISDSIIDDGMGNPTCTASPYSNTASSNGNGVADRGLVEIIGSGNQVSMHDIDWAHGNVINADGTNNNVNMADTTPCVYNESPKTMLSRFKTYTRNHEWSPAGQLPVVKGTTPLISDASMSVIA